MSQLSIRKHNASFAGLFAGAVLLLSPIPAHADAGIPMLPIAYSVILLFLVPVIAIEALYLRLRLHTGWKDTWAATSKANLVTMLLGYPLAWLVYLGLEYGLAITGVTDHLSWAPGTHIASILDIVTTAAWMGPENGGHWDTGQFPWPALCFSSRLLFCQVSLSHSFLAVAAGCTMKAALLDLYGRQISCPTFSWRSLAPSSSGML